MSDKTRKLGITKLNYYPSTHRSRTFHDVRPAFESGESSPRDYLESCLEVIASREPILRGWVVLNEKGARDAADASARRYREGVPLSVIDGMPVGIKDLIETKDMPTQMGCDAFKGNFPKNDSAVVRALRDAGAIILGKTVTTSLGFLDPGPTTNAFDSARTPGGSSSGSGAVVGAGMVPLAIGSQLVGSVLRPASYNANWALKPSYGAINRGERQGYSQSHIGVHANSAQDMWNATHAIVQRVGGDPGHPGLYGGALPPAPKMPTALVVLETEGWKRADLEAIQTFELLLLRLEKYGVRLVRRADNPLVELLEQAISDASDLSLRLISWEQRWTLENLAEQHPGTLGPSLLRQLETGRSQTLSDFRSCLLQRDHARQRMAALTTIADGCITLSACGPAPLIIQAKDTKYPTGDVSFACVSSLLGSPAVTVPALAVGGLPLGVQLIGQIHQDEAVTALARWLEGAANA
jgi:Asp-tRNA(Asn)/Glu-tRNA(Gln) amidotransferase A subunit family amidase